MTNQVHESDKFVRIGVINDGLKPFDCDPMLKPSGKVKEKRAVILGKTSKTTQSQCAFLMGKVIETSKGESFLNNGVWIDATFPHAMLIAGKRGSGKSWDLGIIAEGLSADVGSDIAFGTEKFAREIDLYVKKEHRGKMEAIMMMKMFKAWAKTKNAKEIIFEPGGVDNTNRFDAMAKRLDMKEVGKIYRGDL